MLVERYFVCGDFLRRVGPPVASRRHKGSSPVVLISAVVQTIYTILCARDPLDNKFVDAIVVSLRAMPAGPAGLNGAEMQYSRETDLTTVLLAKHV